jgi:large subunit ribosomal protein L30e
MALDEKKEIRRAVDTGQVLFGLRSAEKNLLNGQAELIILTSSTPRLSREKVEHQAKVAGTPFYQFKGSAHELGAVCGKPFVISVLTVLNPGKSKVLSLAKENRQ